MIIEDRDYYKEKLIKEQNLKQRSNLIILAIFVNIYYKLHNRSILKIKHP